MWKYNKYSIGEIVGHKKTPSLEFRVIDVMCGVPEKKGNYLYVCIQIFNRNRKIHDEYNYHEEDIFPIRKASAEELGVLLNEALSKEDYEKAGSIKDEINKLQNL